jgi:Protein of unknown function (DUF2934)
MPRAKTPRTPKPKAEKAENKVLQMPEAMAAASGNGNGNHDIEAEIRRRAYELYESRGYADGQAEQDWIEAEREVLARESKKHTA